MAQNNLQSAFANEKLDRKNFAVVCGMSPSTLSKILNCKRTPSPRTMEKIVNGINRIAGNQKYTVKDIFPRFKS